MKTGVKQGLILGAIVGVLVSAAFVALTDVWWCLLLIPVCAVMGAAPQMDMFKGPKQEDDE